LEIPFLGGRTYIVSHRIGRTCSGPPPEVEVLDYNKLSCKILEINITICPTIAPYFFIEGLSDRPFNLPLKTEKAAPVLTWQRLQSVKVSAVLRVCVVGIMFQLWKIKMHISPAGEIMLLFLYNLQKQVR
jgi:hypothetical protein